MFKTVRYAVAVVAAAALLVACGSSDDKSSSSSSSASKSSAGKPVTIEWWHIQNNDPMKTIWANAAKQYMTAHPNVKINITVLENEAFESKLTTTMQGGKVPDIFQSWGGGTLKEQADAGLRAGRQRGHQAVDRRPQSGRGRPLPGRRQAVR